MLPAFVVLSIIVRLLLRLSNLSWANIASVADPDENFAREIMQLFSVGLWQLHDNGTRVADANGNFVPTYDNVDIMVFARAWTGFDLQAARGNIENPYLPPSNYIDPMQIKAAWRDQEPKRSLSGGYVGDG